MVASGQKGRHTDEGESEDEGEFNGNGRVGDQRPSIVWGTGGVTEFTETINKLTFYSPETSCLLADICLDKQCQTILPKFGNTQGGRLLLRAGRRDHCEQKNTPRCSVFFIGRKIHPQSLGEILGSRLGPAEVLLLLSPSSSSPATTGVSRLTVFIQINRQVKN